MLKPIVSIILVASAAPAAIGERERPKAAVPACIQQSLLASPVVRDDGRVFFRGQPDVRHSYIAVFKGRACPGLNRFATVIVESLGSRYCEGDRVRVLTGTGTLPGSVCIIDRLVPVDGDTVG